MELYLTYLFILLKIVGLNGQLTGPIRRNPGPQQQQSAAAANFAVNTLNQQNRQKGGARWYTLTMIQNSNTQSMNGLVHTLDMILTESMCPNAINYQGATQTQCPPYNGGAVMRCSVTVWQQPMSLNFRLQNSNCSPANAVSNQIGTAQTGNTVNNQQVSPSGSTNPSQGLRDAANFATNQLNSQNRQQARTRKWYTLMDVRNPGQQTSNNMVYNMDILLSESNCPNAIAYINASPSRCPPAPGSDSQLCSVVVTYTPTRVGYRLTKYNCQKYQQQQQNTQGSVGTVSQGRATQASTLISPPSFTTSGHLSTISNPPNTGSPNTITVNVPNLRANIGTNPQQITPNQAFTQAGQQNLRPSIGASQNLFQRQQPTQVGATTNVQVNTGFPRSTMGFNPGTTNAAGSINLSGLGPRLPQTNRLQNPISGVNIGPTNPGSSINLSGMGAMLPPTNLPQNVNSRVGGLVQTGRSQIAVPGQIDVPGQMQTISLTGTQTQFTPRGQPTNNAGITTAAGIPFQQPQINPQNPNFRASNSGQMGQGQIAGQGQIGVPGQRLGGPQTQFIPRGQPTNNGPTVAAGVNLQQTGQIDSQVTAAANFATNAYNAKSRQQFSTEDKWYTLIDISNVQRQGNGGSNINMDINLQQSSCFNTAASTGATVNHCPPIPGGKVSLCSVSVVYDSTEQGFSLLSSTCRDPRPQQMRTGSVQSSVSSSTASQQNSATTQTSGASGTTSTSSSDITNSQKNAKIRRAATTATNEINVQSRQNNANDNKWYTLVEIQDPQIQNVGGSIIDMNLVLSQSNCLNVAANVGASSSRCPASTGGLKKVCSVKMWHESFNVEDKLLSFTCQQSQTAVVQGPTVQQQTQQQSMSISGLQPAQTASSIITGAVLNNPVKSSASQVAAANIVSSGSSTGGQLRSGFSPASLTGAGTSSGVATGASAPSTALTQAGVNTNTGIPPNGMANMGSTAQTSNNLNQGSLPNTNSATAQLGLNSRVNAQSASMGAVSGSTNGASAGSSQGSPRVIDVANFAANEINTRSKSIEQSWFTLVDISNATRQELISGGWVYKMEIIMDESTCQNIESSFDASNLQCPEINGGRVRICRIEVLDQPNIPGLQLDKLDCMLNSRTQPGPNNIPPNTPLQQQVPPATNTGVPQVTPDTPEIMDAARFAAQDINMQIRQEPNIIDPKWYTLTNVRNAQQAFLGGMVYSMEIDLVESTCQNIDQYINANTTQCPPQNKATTKTCYIEVERVPLLLSYKLKTQHCSTHAFSTNTSLFTKPASQAIANQTQDMKAAAGFAVNKINEQNRKPNSYRYVLVNIHNPRQKSFSGWEYRMNLMLQESTCPNTPAYNDATDQQCPPQIGGPLRICEVKVLHQPWTFGYRLENAHCLNQ